MENNLTIFNFENKQLRTVEIDNVIYFVAKDVCEALDLSDVSQSVESLDKDEKGKYNIRTLGGNQEMLVVNESGLYSLVFKSRKPEAKAFKRWVTRDVIPSIRKTGEYKVKPKNTTDNLVADFAEDRIKLAQLFGLNKNQSLLRVNKLLIREKGVDAIADLEIELESEKKAKTFTPTELGSMIGLKPRAFNLLLESKGFQIKENKQWCPTLSGEKHCEVLDVDKSHKSGAPVKQIKWYESILPLIV